MPRKGWNPARKRPVLVVGIDFGTTYSGIAWACAATSHEIAPINVILRWNRVSTGHSDKEKVPSIITYNKESGTPSDWGYDVPLGSANEQIVGWFKLLLLDEKDMPPYLRTSKYLKKARAILKSHNKHAVEVVADYLRLLWGHSIPQIKRAIGETVLESSKFKIIVTLPAIWPAYAQSRMREAVAMAGVLDPREAGETDLAFISEPEAAALATLSDVAIRGDLEKNDHFVVCDAGGGTVDVIAYKVQKLHPVTLHESVTGTGNLYGAVALDDGFLSRLRAKMSQKSWNSLGRGDKQAIVSDNWEKGIKMEFTKECARDWTIDTMSRGNGTRGSNSPAVHLTTPDIWNIYKPILAENAELVLGQIRQVKMQYNTTPKYVILVGGFGKSEPLYNYITEEVRKEAPDTRVLQSLGERPWTTICRGAVMQGLGKIKSTAFTSPLVETRIARVSIGTLYNISWDAELHDVRDKEWCQVLQEFQAVDQLRWFIEVGNPICSEEAVTASFFQLLEKAEEVLTTDLVYSDGLVAPRRHDDTIKKLCQIKWSHVPKFEDLPVWTNKKGKKYRQVEYEIRMAIDSGYIDFQVFYQDKMVASKNVAVDFEGSGHAVARRS